MDSMPCGSHQQSDTESYPERISGHASSKGAAHVWCLIRPVVVGPAGNRKLSSRVVAGICTPDAICRCSLALRWRFGSTPHFSKDGADRSHSPPISPRRDARTRPGRCIGRCRLPRPPTNSRRWRSCPRRDRSAQLRPPPLVRAE